MTGGRTLPHATGTVQWCWNLPIALPDGHPHFARIVPQKKGASKLAPEEEGVVQ
jgi:hypothetical protein